jgi:hypothetical protein
MLDLLLSSGYNRKWGIYHPDHQLVISPLMLVLLPHPPSSGSAVAKSKLMLGVLDSFLFPLVILPTHQRQFSDMSEWGRTIAIFFCSIASKTVRIKST